MAEIQKPVELPKEETPVVPAVEPTTTEAAPALAVEDKPAEESKAVEATEAKAEDKPAEEVKSVEEGHLSHKAQGASFPKNLIPTKEFFFFGSESFDPKALAAYLKGEKNTEHAHHNASWASHTGNGLLFVGDKKAPSSIINLADTTEPETDGANKFSFNHKGAKHSFKAASTAERNSWVAQLKAKIAEAKELAATVTESEAYKTALESFKPAPKEEKPADEVKAEEPAVPEAAAAAEGETAPIATEAKPVEEPKSRSASRKRASIFGFGKKDSFKEKKEEVKSEEPIATETAEPVAEPVAQPAAIAEPVAEPIVEAAKTEETPAETEATPAVEEKPTEEVESPKEKPTVSKRNSIFGGVFAKKDKKVVEPTKATDETVKEGEVSTDAAAPVIPPVESTTPLNAEEVNAAGENVATPASAAEPAVKKDVKEKRKSSLPFAFGRREKSPSPVDGDEKTEKSDKRTSQSPFSKLRATIKGKSGAKAEEKPVGEAVKEESAATETAAAAAPEAETAASAEPVKVAEAETENKPENVASTTPAVTAAA